MLVPATAVLLGNLGHVQPFLSGPQAEHSAISRAHHPLRRGRSGHSRPWLQSPVQHAGVVISCPFQSQPHCCLQIYLDSVFEYRQSE